MSLYYITHSFARSFTFFIFSKRTHSLTFFVPISHVRYIYESKKDMSESKMKPRLRAESVEKLTGMISLLRDKFASCQDQKIRDVVLCQYEEIQFLMD